MDPTVDKAEELGLSGERLARIPAFFDEKYVRAGKLPGVVTAVSRRGRLAAFDVRGRRDVARGEPMTADTVFRIYSMTKPIVSAALMTLYEEGAFQLSDPVSRFIAPFAGLRVWADGNPTAFRTKLPEREMTVRDLLTHTSGLTYGFMYNHPVDALYRRRGVERPNPLAVPENDAPATTTAEMVERLADVPLLYSPGTRWAYSVATDVCGRLVEIISGRPLDAFLTERIFRPLGMVDTGFSVAPDAAHRLAANYAATAADQLRLIDDPATSEFLSPPTFLAGGGGLVSTAADYLRFAHMLLGRGELDGVRVLGRKTVEYMTTNHLPGGRDLAAMGQPVFGNTIYEGVGFGLGFSVVLDPVRAQVVNSPGSYAWGGAASTVFWVDPREELVVLLLTQLTPSATYPLRQELQALAYQALID
jgi:CubicO group peptidase (beta-lactamase class C family)